MLEDFDYFICFWDNKNYSIRLGRERKGEMESGTYELRDTVLKFIPSGKPSPYYHNFTKDLIFCGQNIFIKSGSMLPK